MRRPRLAEVFTEALLTNDRKGEIPGRGERRGRCQQADCPEEPRVRPVPGPSPGAGNSPRAGGVAGLPATARPAEDGMVPTEVTSWASGSRRRTAVRAP